MFKVILLGLIVNVFATMGIPKSAKLPEDHPLMVRASSCIDDIDEVVKEFPAEVREPLARLTFVVAEKEGACLANPVGHNDAGHACGVMQVWYPWWEVPGVTCADVRRDRKLGLRVGMRRLFRLYRKCGGWGAGLTAYATNGACTGKWVLPLAKERCALAGVACN